MKPKILKAGNSHEVIEGKEEDEVIPDPVKRGPQEIVDNLIWRHGANLPNWASWEDELTKAGLRPQDVTKAMVAKAVENMRKRLNGSLLEPEPSGELGWRKPVQEVNQTSVWDSWWTECRRYRVVRSVSTLKGGENHFSVGYVKGLQFPNDQTVVEALPNHHRTLENAMLAAEKLFGIQHQAKRVTSNSKQRIEEARRLGLDRLPVDLSDPDFSSQPEEKIMNIKEKAARNLLKACGNAKADDITLTRLTAKLNDQEYLGGLTKPADETAAAAYDAVIEALAAGNQIVVKAKAVPVEEGGSEKPAKDAVGKNGKVPKEKSEGGKTRDRFGAWGAEQQAINAAIGATYETVEEITARTGGLSKSRVRSQLKWLVKGGHLVEKGDKFKVKV